MSWIYETNSDNSARYILGERGENPLVCIGVNPSTAEPDKLDPTLRSVKAWAKRLGFDGWIMLNLYPQRATNPNDLPQRRKPYLTDVNNYKISKFFYNEPKYTTIWAA